MTFRKRLATFKGSRRIIDISPIILAKRGYVFNPDPFRVECYLCRNAFGNLDCIKCRNKNPSFDTDEDSIFEHFVHQTVPATVFGI